MDFLDPAKKRSHQRRLLIGYILVGIAIIIGALVLVYQSYGYTIDRHTGQVIQNGLVFVSAHPDSADIYINGQRNGKTDTRLVLPSGEYTISLKRDGYRTWQRAFNLDGGSVERLTYPALFPTKLVTTDAQLYASLPPTSSSSPDRRWILVGQPGNVGNFDLFDTSDATKQSVVVSVPTSLMSQGTDQQLTVQDWADDNRHVMLLHTFKGGQEHILFDREVPTLSISLEKTFNVAPTTISFKDKKYDQYYFYTTAGGTLVSADLKNKTTTPVLTHVLTYKDHESGVVLYITDDGATGGKAKVVIHDSAGEHVLRELPASPSYVLDIAKYSGQWFAAAGASSEGKVYVYKNPVSALAQNTNAALVPASVLKVASVDTVSFSANQQFVMAEHGSSFSVYDIENDRRYQYDIKLPVDAVNGLSHAVWMDGDRLIVLSAGKVVVFDYDDANLQTLSAASQPPLFNRDYTAMYAVAPSSVAAGRSALTLTALKVK